MNDAATHRAAFARRLLEALKKIGYDNVGATTLCRLFNSHYPGKEISVCATRKWLRGEAIPTRDKLVALARLLSVAPDWLLFGTGCDEIAPGDKVPTLSADDARMLAEVRRLGPNGQAIARQIVTLLVKMTSTNREGINQ